MALKKINNKWIAQLVQVFAIMALVISGLAVIGLLLKKAYVIDIEFLYNWSSGPEIPFETAIMVSCLAIGLYLVGVALERLGTKT